MQQEIWAMQANRMEAFSDGVIAIIITIMVIELKAPEGTSFAELKPLWPVFLSYILSFLFIGIYWSNHHHLLQATEKIQGNVLWVNLVLLFCLSLIPFASAWMGETDFAKVPVSIYGSVLFMTACSYYALERLLIEQHDVRSVLAQALKWDHKGIRSIILYGIAIPVSLFAPYIALGIYGLVAFQWLIPNRKIEEKLEEQE
jgi:uncharacterized membrane protein